jgi:hypothetical protein
MVVSTKNATNKLINYEEEVAKSFMNWH